MRSRTLVTALAVLGASTVASAVAAGPALASGYGAPTTVVAGLDEPTVLAENGTDLYVDDYEDGQVVKVAADGTQSVVASGYVSLLAIGVDRADDVFGADDSSDQVDETTASGTESTITSSSSLGGLAVDGAGDAFVLEGSYYGGQDIVEFAHSGVQTTLPGTFTHVQAIAVSPSGTLYLADGVADLTVGATVQKVAANGTTTTIGSGYNDIQELAVDAAGDVYVVDQGGGEVDRIAPHGVTSAVALGLQYPAGVAVDGAGDVDVSTPLAGSVQRYPADGTDGSTTPTVTTTCAKPTAAQQRAADAGRRVSISCRARVTASAGPPTGTVTFNATTNAGQVLGLSPVACTLPATATPTCAVKVALDSAGTYFVTGAYGGDPTDAPRLRRTTLTVG